METLLSLESGHRDAITAHLVSLGAGERSDRFMGPVNDAYIKRYVDSIDYGRDVLIGATQGCRLVGFAHAAEYLEDRELLVEVGVSVALDVRQRGLGKRLLLATIEAAKRFDVRRVDVLFRSTNAAMAGLARSAGGRLERSGSESVAVFEITISACPIARAGSSDRAHSFQ